MSFMKKAIGLLNGFRKFTIMMLVIITGITFRITDLINGAELVDLFKGTVIAFFSFNGIEHVTGVIKDFIKKK